VEDVRVQDLLALLMNSTKPLTPPAKAKLSLLALRSSTRRIFTPLFRKLSSRSRLASTS
jgi:hypothetical protein